MRITVDGKEYEIDAAKYADISENIAEGDIGKATEVAEIEPAKNAGGKFRFDIEASSLAFFASL